MNLTYFYLLHEYRSTLLVQNMHLKKKTTEKVREKTHVLNGSKQHGMVVG